MTNKQKVTRRSLFASVLSLTVCAGMLVGTSYAWFTDTATSSGNIVKTGTLNIDLAIKTKTDEDYVSVKTDPDKKAFNYERWEPGYTEWVNAKVFTTGNLALKYTMKINADGEVTDLADVIDVYYKDSAVQKPLNRDLSGLQKIGTLRQALNGDIVINDTLIPGAADADIDETAGITDQDFATIALHMQEEAGNEYQNMSIGSSFSFQILATQYTYEIDSFDDKYDAGAFIGSTILTAGDKSYIVSEDLKNSIEDKIGEDGKIPANDPTVFNVRNSADLVAISKMINDGVISFNNGEVQRTINILDDIDMTGSSWTPIRVMRVNMNGNGHTISNITGPLYGYAGGCRTENLTLENVTASASQAAAFAGNSEDSKWTNCTLAGNVDITYTKSDENWSAVGAVVGWNTNSTFDNVKIADNTVINIDARGIEEDHAAPGNLTYDTYVGTGSYTGITVGENVTVNYKKDWVVGGMTFSNVSDQFVTDLTPHLDNNGNVKNEAFSVSISEPEDLFAFSKLATSWAMVDWATRATLNITNDLDFDGIDWTGIIRTSIVINGNNHVISNLNNPLVTRGGGTEINNLTINNITASGDQVGAFVTSGEGITLNNCTLAGNIDLKYEHKTTETYRAVGALVGWAAENMHQFNNIKVADNTTITIDMTGIEDGHSNVDGLNYDIYIGHGPLAQVTEGSNVTKNLIRTT